MLLKRDPVQDGERPARVGYSRYYEHDGRLRAFANRAMFLGFGSMLIALIAVGLAAYVRMQPPTVIRVDANGNSTMLGAGPSLLKVSQNAADAEPSELEKWAFAKLFLDRYLTFSPSNVSRNWADALNMMTSNLRRLALSKMQTQNLVGKIEDEQTRSEFHLRRLEPVKDSPLTRAPPGPGGTHFPGRGIANRRTGDCTTSYPTAESGAPAAECRRRSRLGSYLSVRARHRGVLRGRIRQWRPRPPDGSRIRAPRPGVRVNRVCSTPGTDPDTPSPTWKGLKTGPPAPTCRKFDRDLDPL